MMYRSKRRILLLAHSLGSFGAALAGWPAVRSVGRSVGRTTASGRPTSRLSCWLLDWLDEGIRQRRANFISWWTRFPSPRVSIVNGSIVCSPIYSSVRSFVRPSAVRLSIHNSMRSFDKLRSFHALRTDEPTAGRELMKLFRSSNQLGQKR